LGRRTTGTKSHTENSVAQGPGHASVASSRAIGALEITAPRWTPSTTYFRFLGRARPQVGLKVALSRLGRRRTFRPGYYSTFTRYSQACAPGNVSSRFKAMPACVSVSAASAASTHLQSAGRSKVFLRRRPMAPKPADAVAGMPRCGLPHPPYFFTPRLLFSSKPLSACNASPNTALFPFFSFCRAKALS